MDIFNDSPHKENGMKKLRYIEVVCVPSKGYWISSKGDDGLRKDATELIAQIKRHCDHFEDLSPRPVWECEFCESEYEEIYDSEYKRLMPACCSKAEIEALANIPVGEFKKP